MTDKPKKPPGPEPERLKLTGNWMENVKKALDKKRPADGWPQQKQRPGPDTKPGKKPR